MALASLIVSIGADLTDLNRAVDGTDRQIQRFGRKLTGFGQSLSIAVTAPLTAIAAVGIRSAQQLESFGAALRVLIGDAERADGVFDELYEFSAKSPFDWKSLSDGTRMLAAFGVEAEEIVPTLRRIGDIASGTGNNIAELAELYGKAQVQGRLMAEDINQLTGRGIPIIAELAKQFGVAESEVRGLVSSGQVGFSNLEEAFVSLTSEGGKFYDMTAIMSETSAGKMATLKDSFEQVADIVGARLLPVFDAAVEKVQRWVQWFVELDEGTQNIIVAVGGFAAAMGPLLLAVGTALKYWPLMKIGIKALTGPIGLTMAAVVALGIAWAKWGDDIKWIVNSTVAAVVKFAQDVAKRLEWLTGPLATLLTAWWEFEKAVVKLMGDLAAFVIGKAAEIVTGLFEWLRDKLAPLGRAVETVIQPIVTFFGDLSRSVVRISEEIVAKVWDVFTGGLRRVADGVATGLGWITDKFQHMSDVLVGNSIVPDMVQLIKAEFDDLSEHMILTTVEATARTTEEFAKIEASFTDTMNGTLRATQDAVRAWSDVLPESVAEVVDKVSGVWEKIHTALTLKDTLQETWRDWVDFATRFVGAVNDLWKKVGFVLGKLAEVFSGPRMVGVTGGYQQGGGVPFYAPPGSQPAYSMDPGMSYSVNPVAASTGAGPVEIQIGPIVVQGNVIGTTVEDLAAALAVPISRALGREVAVNRQRAGGAFAS